MEFKKIQMLKALLCTLLFMSYFLFRKWRRSDKSGKWGKHGTSKSDRHRRTF